MGPGRLGLDVAGGERRPKPGSPRTLRRSLDPKEIIRRRRLGKPRARRPEGVAPPVTLIVDGLMLVRVVLPVFCTVIVTVIDSSRLEFTAAGVATIDEVSP